MMRFVALVDWHWSGHHPTFFNHFIMALEELGIGVIALCPDPVAAEQQADRTRQRSARFVSMPRTLFGKVVLPKARFPGLRPRRISEIDLTVRHFTLLEKNVRKVAADAGVTVDAIFYACVYDRDFQWFHYARPFLRIPWAGLYMHATSYRMPGRCHPGSNRLPHPRRIFRGRNCLGLALLDEGIADRVRDHLKRPVVVFPDPPDKDVAPDEAERVLGDGLRKFAGGRPVVGLFGHLLKSKGLYAFLEAASLPEASGLCFALGGEMLWPFDEAERSWLHDLIDGLPNLWKHIGRIPTEAALSHLMGSCDVIAAAYLDFPHSSGIQAKAAALGKPIIVSDGYLMAERVRRFRTGEVIPQGNARRLLDAALAIMADRDGWLRSMRPQWQDYLEEHSVERLPQAFAGLLFRI